MTQPARSRPPFRRSRPDEPSPQPAAAAPLRRLLSPLRQVAAAFFKHDVALRRADDGLHIVFEERATPGKQRPDTPAEAAARRQEEQLALMRSQLCALLDEMPGTRHAMRHLGFVEQALAGKGLKALDRLPLDVLQRALEQFEGLVTNWSPVGLAALRSKIAVAIIDREQRDLAGDAGSTRATAVPDSASLGERHTLPVPLVETADDEALAAAYAALGALAPGAAAEPMQAAGELTLSEMEGQAA